MGSNPVGDATSLHNQMLLMAGWIILELLGGGYLRECPLTGEDLLVLRVVVHHVGPDLPDLSADGNEAIALLLHIRELVAEELERLLVRFSRGRGSGELELLVGVPVERGYPILGDRVLVSHSV